MMLLYQAIKVMMDYTTSVRSQAYSNIVQVNTHQTLNGSSISLTYIGLAITTMTSLPIVLTTSPQVVMSIATLVLSLLLCQYHRHNISNTTCIIVNK